MLKLEQNHDATWLTTQGEDIAYIQEWEHDPDVYDAFYCSSYLPTDELLKNGANFEDCLSAILLRWELDNA